MSKERKKERRKEVIVIPSVAADLTDQGDMKTFHLGKDFIMKNLNPQAFFKSVVLNQGTVTPLYTLKSSTKVPQFLNWPTSKL